MPCPGLKCRPGRVSIVSAFSGSLATAHVKGIPDADACTGCIRQKKDSNDSSHAKSMAMGRDRQKKGVM